MTFSADLKDIELGDVFTIYDKKNKATTSFQVISIQDLKKDHYSLLCLETFTCAEIYVDKKEDLLKYLKINSRGLKLRKRLRLKMKW